MPDIEKNPGRFIAFWGFILLGAIILLTLIGNALGIANIYWQAEKAKLTIKPRITQQIYTPENAFAQINFFHDQCRGVVADLNIFKNNRERYEADVQAAHLETDPIKRQADIEALSTEQQDVTGALNAAQQAAQAYNSQSAKYTATPFKDHNLPYRIELPAGEAAAANFIVNCQ